MKKVLSFILQVLGVIFVCLAAFIAFQLWNTGKGKTNFSKSDVKFVLNWGGLNPDQDFEIINAHKHSHGMMDDYEEVYCLQLTDSTIGEHEQSNWIYGESTDPTLIRIRQETANIADMGTCLNGIHDGNSEQINAYIFGVRFFSGSKIGGAEVLYLNAETNRLLFVGHQF